MNRKFILVLLLIIFDAAFSFAMTKEELMDFDYNNTYYYPVSFSKNINEKIHKFESHAETFLELVDDCDGYENYNLTADEVDLFNACFMEMPQLIKKTFLDKVYAVYFVQGMNYAALTTPVFDENGNVFCNLFFNCENLHVSMTVWNEYRDNSIFISTDNDNKIKVDCSDEYPVLLQVLMHESVHVYDYVYNVTPDLFEEVQKDRTDSLFFKVWKNQYQPVNKYRNKKLEQTGYYEYGKKLPVKEGKKIVEYMSKTPFSTLYGAKNWKDDFAETITSYWLLNKYGIDYKLTFIEKGKETSTYCYSKNENVNMWLPLCKRIVGE